MLCLAVLAGGCGAGAAKPAEAAEGSEAKADKPAETGKDSEKASDAKPDEAKPESDKKADSKSPPADDGPKPTRTPEDILTAPDVVFMFSFNDSEPKQVADEKCTKKAGNDPKKMNECMRAAAKQFPAEGHRFKKDEKGQWWWITVHQTGDRLNAVHKVPIEFGEQTDTSITLKPVGKDKGSKPTAVPAKVVIEVPNDYQIAIKDPKAGRLVFQAKVGSITE